MTVKIFAGQETVSVNLTEPMKISQALDLAGQHMDLPCAGNGRCGKCKVKALGSLSPLSPEEKKRFLMEILDKNMLYVNLCDLDDSEFRISDEDRAFTRSFYGED